MKKVFMMTSVNWNISTHDLKRLSTAVGELTSELEMSPNRMQTEFSVIIELRRKLNFIEEEKLEMASLYNEELSKRESQLTVLRSQVERGEAVLQSLEYDLAVARKDASIERCSLEQMLVNANKEQEILKVQNEDLRQRLSSVEDLIKLSQHNWEEKQNQFQSDLEEKDGVIKKCNKEIEKVNSEKNYLNKKLQEQDKSIQNMQKKFEDLQAERKSYLDSIQRQEDNLNYYYKREDVLKHELEAAALREQTLAKEVEAHIQDSKINSDLLLLRIKELEKCLQTEKASQDEAMFNLDKLRKQYTDLEISFQKEKANADEWSQKLLQSQEAYKCTLNKLTVEMEDKDKAIESFSKKCQKLEKSCGDLQKDLDQVRACNASLEDATRDYCRELKLLVNSFSNQCAKIRFHTDGPLTPSFLLKSLKEMLLAYECQITLKSNELADTRERYEEKKKESDAVEECKLYLSRKLQESNKQLTLVTGELDELRKAHVKNQCMIDSLQKELKNTNECLEREKESATRRCQQAESYMQAMNDELEEKKKCFYSIYQHLVSGRVLPKTDILMGTFTIDELYAAIQEHTTYLLQELEKEKQNVVKHEKIRREKSDAMSSLQKTCDETLKNYSNQMKAREISWQKQKKDLELQFAALLQESQLRAEKCQEIAEKNKENNDVLEKIKDQLSIENVKCKDQLTTMKEENTSLLIACALMAGALNSLYSRSCALSIQKELLQDQLKTYEIVKKDIMAMSQAFFNAEEKRKHGAKLKKKQAKSMIHVFRKGVIVVLAANRLQYFGQSCNSLFTWIDGINEGPGILVCGITSPGLSAQKNEQQLHDLVNWFRNSDLLGEITSSVSDLKHILDTVGMSSRSSARLIINAARSCFSKLMETLSVRIARAPLSRNLLRASDRGSLSQSLSHGLHKVDSNALKAGIMFNRPILKSVASLQRHICEFTQRLQKCEEERRSMRLEKADLKHTIQKLNVETQQLQDQLVKCWHINLTEANTRLNSKDQYPIPADRHLSYHDQDRNIKEDSKSKAESIVQTDKQYNHHDQEMYQLEESIHKAESCLRLSVK
ncbi:hypothetical protein NDU88_002945 [Pleurodeles waltl]|uniref:Coiled-coil domain-containing protein 171 n=1 Tax=Pleurodeles waltl TaxID=8319 RepID=A0AAV7RGW0_PLEWA|nr:hypothetical protein NDU88_002945 [Pleurodeles waltl]